MDAVRIALSGGHEAIVDASDYQATHTVHFKRGLSWTGCICDLTWCASIKQHTTYVTCMLQGSLELRLHRVVMDATTGQLVDHIDHDGLNNRRANLRLATFVGNSANRQPTRASSRFKGVCLSRRSSPKTWQAYIRVNGVKRHLGCFRDEMQAAHAYDIAALEAFGDFAHTNFEAD